MWITFCKKGLPSCETKSLISYNLHNFITIRIHIMEINMSISLQDNLAKFKGNDISLVLKNGTTVEGILKDINQSIIHIEMLKGRDYFDAVVSTSELASFVFKSR